MNEDMEKVQSVMCGAIAGTSGMTHIDFQQCETIVFSEKYCVIAGAYTLSKASNDRWTIIELAYTVAFEKRLVIWVEIFGLKSEVKKRRFIVKQGDKVVFVLLSDVLHIESMRNDLLWHCADGIYKERVTQKSRCMDFGECFVRLGRSFFVNPEHVTSIGREGITLTSGEMLSVPRRNYDRVRQELVSCLTVDTDS